MSPVLAADSYPLRHQRSLTPVLRWGIWGLEGLREVSVRSVVGGSAEMWVFLGSAQLPQEAEESHTASWDRVRLSQLMKSILRCECFPKLLIASRGLCLLHLGETLTLVWIVMALIVVRGHQGLLFWRGSPPGLESSPGSGLQLTWVQILYKLLILPAMLP